MIKPLERRSTTELFVMANAYVNLDEVIDNEAFADWEKIHPMQILRNVLLNVLYNRIGIERLKSDGYINDYVRIM